MPWNGSTEGHLERYHHIIFESHPLKRIHQYGCFVVQNHLSYYYILTWSSHLLAQEHALLSALDTGQFCRDRDVKEIISLVEVLVGAAVQCPEKAQHINRIMNLSVDSQSTLQALIQSSLSKTSSFLSSSAAETSTPASSPPPYIVPVSV